MNTAVALEASCMALSVGRYVDAALDPSSLPGEVPDEVTYQSITFRARNPPAMAKIATAIVYQVATKRGESSVQCEA
ncbi:hypothetical protein SAMN04244575_06458 [Sinorhizobium meliloti]|nr:hypothetical protein SAMN04244575_06458 [Sinorhizobium meliloti]